MKAREPFPDPQAQAPNEKATRRTARPSQILTETPINAAPHITMASAVATKNRIFAVLSAPRPKVVSHSFHNRNRSRFSRRACWLLAIPPPYHMPERSASTPRAKPAARPGSPKSKLTHYQTVARLPGDTYASPDAHYVNLATPDPLADGGGLDPKILGCLRDAEPAM
jgi:hypothetical protein